MSSIKTKYRLQFAPKKRQVGHLRFNSPRKNAAAHEFRAEQNAYAFRLKRGHLTLFRVREKLLFRRRKPAFIHRAQRTYKVLGNICPFGSGRDSALRIALCLVVFPTADITHVFHFFFLLFHFIFALYNIISRKPYVYAVSACILQTLQKTKPRFPTRLL